MEPHTTINAHQQDYMTVDPTNIDKKLGDNLSQRPSKFSNTSFGVTKDTTITRIPTRIRIRSEILRNEINNIVGTVQNENHARPFRSLVHFEKEFKQRLQEAERIYEKLMAKSHFDQSGPAATVKYDTLSMFQDDTEADEPADMKMTPTAKLLQAKRLKDGLRCLVLFLNVDLKDIMEVRQNIKAGDLAAISFIHLAYLFSPGEQVISTKPKDQLFRVLQVCGGSLLFDRHRPGDSTRGKISNLIIDTFYIDFDGKQFRAAPEQIVIHSYDGFRKVTSLDMYPLKFHATRLDVEKKLIARGGKFMRLIQGMHKKYQGLSIQEGESYAKPEQINSDVIIDFELAFRNSNPLIKPSSFDGGLIQIPTSPESRDSVEHVRINERYLYEDDLYLNRIQSWEFWDNTDLLDPQPVGTLNKDRLILSLFRVYGYVLLSRKWYPLDADLVQDIEQAIDGNADGFSELVLPRGHKGIVQALINMHARVRGVDSTERRHVDVPTRHTDLVKGKGRGLIILLHGAPGVGKTSTAECVATNTNRPLLSITCGDISGVSVKEMEQSLQGYFDLAREWGCVLLLDEADVFLSERTKGDLQQNSLVSGMWKMHHL
ncbi:hypothetical protein MMC18_008674 [Xylographa bjoerkii]|nr:hypothetical protein [Xylographa bjoerkii]